MRRRPKPKNEPEPEERSAVQAAEERHPAPLKDAPRLSPEQSAVLELQRSRGNQFVVGMLQRKRARDGETGAPADAAALDGLPRTGGEPLDDRTRAAMESRLGHDFGGVRIHRDPPAERAAQSLNAQAFTVGPDIYFGSGRYCADPSDPLLAHELTHVAQQSAAGTSAPGAEGLEAQAQRAERAVTGGAGGSEVSAAGTRVQLKSADDTTGAGPDASRTPKKEPSFFERIGHGIAGAARAVGHGIATAATAVGHGIATAATAVGHGVATAAEAVWTGLQWVGRQLWSKVTGIYERIMHWITRLPDRLVRLFTNLWEGVRSVQPWALKWWQSLGQADTWGDFLKWMGTNLIDLMELMGVGEVYETAMDFIKFNTRKMTGTEMDRAASVFGNSINLELVRIDEHAVFGPSWSHREYTSFHVINGWGGIEAATLIHELTHVWQYQQAGAIYMPQALHAQATGGYEYGGAVGLKDRKKAGGGLLSFNREQQAQIVQDFYLLKHHGEPLFRDAERSDLPLYAHFVKQVSTRTEAELLS